MNNKIIIGVVIGLIAGLMLGVFIGVLIVSPSGVLPSKTGAGINNQVQVSGSIKEAQIIEIEFVSIPNGTVSTSAPVTNGGYSALLIGGQSYKVNLYSANSNIEYPPSLYGTFSLYVPLGVPTFTANF